MDTWFKQLAKSVTEVKKKRKSTKSHGKKVQMFAKSNGY